TIQDSQTLFVKISTNDECYAISTVVLKVLFTPTVSDDETVYYCLSSFPETLRIFGGVLNDSPSNYYYEWFFNGNSTPINTSFYDINEVGSYKVIVTDPNGCSASRTITVLASTIPIIETVSIQEGTFNNTITITTSGGGFYEYS